LLSRIVTGELEVGGLLPKEAELADHYRVNRSVIREAVKLLEVHQLVRPVRRRGTEVLDPVASPSPEVLRAMLMPRPGAIDREAEMSARACERRTDEDLAALEGCLEELRATLHEPRRYGAAVGELVLAVARAGNNRLYQVLVHWHREIQKDLEALFLTMWTASEQHLQGQELLVDLIRKQQADEVRRLLVAYHRWATPRLLAAAALYNGEAPAGAEPVTAEESST
jgi:DNA-binding FadR family transcriptional regulator